MVYDFFQGFSRSMLVRHLAAIRNLQLYQQRLYGRDNKPVHMHESVRADGRVKTMMQLLEKRSTARSRG